jgi:hypothetical protein
MKTFNQLYHVTFSILQLCSIAIVVLLFGIESIFQSGKDFLKE